MSTCDKWPGATFRYPWGDLDWSSAAPVIGLVVGVVLVLVGLFVAWRSA